MKLIDREPTQEMIDAAIRAFNPRTSSLSTFTDVFRAMYDASTENLAEETAHLEKFKVAFEQWIEKTEWVQENKQGLFRGMLGLHRADCMRTVIERQQAEIAKRDERIKDLEADQDKANAAVAIGNYLGKTYNYAWCDTSLASQTIDLLKEQAAEISRLKEALLRITSVPVDTVTIAYGMR